MVEEARIYGFGNHVAPHLRKGAQTSATKSEEKEVAEEIDTISDFKREHATVKRAYMLKEMVRQYLAQQQAPNRRSSS